MFDRGLALRLAKDVIQGRGTRTSSVQGLKTKSIVADNGARIMAIEQNPNKGSEWAARAKAGDKVVQLKEDGRYVGVVVNGELTEY